MAGRNWSRPETLAAFALYCQLPFGKLHSGNPDVIALSVRLGRTPGSVAMKCVNLASLDETHLRRGVVGMKNVSAMDRAVWEEFIADPEAISFEASQAFGAQTPERIPPDDESAFEIPEGKERERVVRVRVNQRFFRRLIMSSFNEACAVCALPMRELLVASHIVPWSVDAALRMNPRNGLCLCGTHDRAFECGLLRINRAYAVQIVVPRKYGAVESVIDWLLQFDGKAIHMPQRWRPDPELLQRKYDLVSEAVENKPRT